MGECCCGIARRSVLAPAGFLPMSNVIVPSRHSTWATSPTHCGPGENRERSDVTLGRTGCQHALRQRGQRVRLIRTPPRTCIHSCPVPANSGATPTTQDPSVVRLSVRPTSSVSTLLGRQKPVRDRPIFVIHGPVANRQLGFVDLPQSNRRDRRTGNYPNLGGSTVKKLSNFPQRIVGRCRARRGYRVAGRELSRSCGAARNSPLAKWGPIAVR